MTDAIPRAERRRLRNRHPRPPPPPPPDARQFESGKDIAALRRFVRLSQTQFAQAMGISIHTLRNWEQDRPAPEGPAIALLRIAARHPRILRENLESAARYPEGGQGNQVASPTMPGTLGSVG